jgi:hypothetical protein
MGFTEAKRKLKGKIIGAGFLPEIALKGLEVAVK